VVTAIPGVIEASAQLGRDVPDWSADVLLCQTVDARPVPDPAEEAPMDFPNGSVGQQIVRFGSSVEPAQAYDDVFGFELVNSPRVAICLALWTSNSSGVSGVAPADS